MKIIVVKTCDGDMYYRADRNAYKWAASEMGAQQVLVNDLSRWNDDDRCLVRTAVECRDVQGTYKALMKIGAIREVELLTK